MRVVDHVVADKQDVRHFTDVQLARLGIRVMDGTSLRLQCVECGETWEPLLDSGGKLPFQYWVCPHKCNL